MNGIVLYCIELNWNELVSYIIFSGLICLCIIFLISIKLMTRFIPLCSSVEFPKSCITCILLVRPIFCSLSKTIDFQFIQEDILWTTKSSFIYLFNFFCFLFIFAYLYLQTVGRVLASIDRANGYRYVRTCMMYLQNISILLYIIIDIV